jgi:hypothetical protein
MKNTVQNIRSKILNNLLSFGMVPITSKFILNGNENMDAGGYIYIEG